MTLRLLAMLILLAGWFTAAGANAAPPVCGTFFEDPAGDDSVTPAGLPDSLYPLGRTNYGRNMDLTGFYLSTDASGVVRANFQLAIAELTVPGMAFSWSGLRYQFRYASGAGTGTGLAVAELRVDRQKRPLDLIPPSESTGTMVYNNGETEGDIYPGWGGVVSVVASGLHPGDQIAITEGDGVVIKSLDLTSEPTADIIAPGQNPLVVPPHC
jgi:hypothetical protein